MREDWTECTFEDLLDYAQPTNYIVKSTKYSDDYKTPVLTAGKSFIKGYTNETTGIFDELPTIIFDDFTTATQFVDFEFKVKSSAMKILVPTSKLVNMKFVFNCIQVNQVRNDTHKRYWISVYAKKKILLPPLVEQNAILAKTEEIFSDLDNGIANFKKAQAQLKIYRQAVLKKAFEGQLTKEWREKQSNLPTAEELLKQIKEERKNQNSDNLPKGWKYNLISEVAEINPALPNKANIDRDLEVQFLPMKLVEEIINKIHLIETRKFVDVLKGSYTPFIDGDIIFAKVTPCMENGKIATVNKLKNGIGFGSSEFHVLRCSEKINNSFLYNFIVQDTFRNKAQAAMTGAVGLRRVPKQFIENYLIPIPSTIEEQTQIVQEIESRLSVCDKVEQSIIDSLLKAEALRQSILKKAFEGKLLSEAEIEQCKKAADYEPASELLKKIQAEKLAKEQAHEKAQGNKKQELKKNSKMKSKK